MAVTLLIGGARSGKSSLAVARALDWQRADSHDRSVVFVATGASGDAEMADRIARHQAERPGSWSTVEAPIDLVTGLRSGAEVRAGKARVGDAGQAGANETALVIDCLSMWVANHLMAPVSDLSGPISASLRVPPVGSFPTGKPDWEPLVDLSGPISASLRVPPVGAVFEEDTPADPLSEPELIDWDAAERELLRQVDECFLFLATRSAPTWFVTNEVGLGLVPVSPLGRRYRDVLGRVNAKVSLLADEAFLTVAGRVLRLERP
jgi:adenosyl cobinamide kinase/adenosyl cobinamide phosphate guanylyltransferase